MKKFMLALSVFAVIGFTSCGSDDDSGSDDDGGSNCQTCPAFEAGGVTVPEIEVCEGENGNAFISGTDTGVEFSLYIDSLEAAGANCS